MNFLSNNNFQLQVVNDIGGQDIHQYRRSPVNEETFNHRQLPSKQ